MLYFCEYSQTIRWIATEIVGNRLLSKAQETFHSPPNLDEALFKGFTAVFPPLTAQLRRHIGEQAEAQSAKSLRGGRAPLMSRDKRKRA
jgi:hypothetical protein